MADLPLDWYGKNFLGRDVTVGVQGESPTGTPTSGVAAIPSGALGSTGPGPGAAAAAGPSAAAGGPSTGGLTELGQGLQAAQLASQGERISALAQAPGASPLAVGPEGIPFASDPAGNVAYNVTLGPGGEALPGGGIPPSEIAGMTAEAQGVEAGTSGAALGPSAAAATLGAAGYALPAGSAQTLAYQQIPESPRLKLDYAMAALDPTQLYSTIPDVLSGKLFGPAPHMPFPAATWAELSNQVSTSLPQALPVPPNATDAQRQQIEQVNGLIGTLQPYTGGLIPQLQGVQSAESWKYAMDHIVPYIKGQFEQLKQLYPQAIQSMQPQQAAPDLSVLRGPQQATGPAQQDIPAGFYRGDKTLTEQ